MCLLNSGLVCLLGGGEAWRGLKGGVEIRLKEAAGLDSVRTKGFSHTVLRQFLRQL